MRPGDRVLLQHTGLPGVPASLHLRWATVVKVRARSLIVRPDRETQQRTVTLDEVRSWSRAPETEA